MIHHRLGLARERVSVAYPGVGEAFFQQREPAPAPDSLRILTVTRISRHTRRKNVDGVLRALASIGDRLPWTYTVVGDGDDRARLEALAGELGIDERVHFTGSVDFEQLLEAYRNADLFILASTGHEQGRRGLRHRLHRSIRRRCCRYLQPGRGRHRWRFGTVSTAC